jgi:hypothetical protein
VPAAPHGTTFFPRVPALGARTRGNFTPIIGKAAAMNRRGPRIVATALVAVGFLALIAAATAEAVLVYAAQLAIGVAERL